MDKILNTYQHVYLYAKNWYKRTNTLEDLKRILSIRSNIGADEISNEDVVRQLLHITYPHIVKSGNPPHFFEELFIDMLPENEWKRYMCQNDDIYTKICKSCLNFLNFVKVSEIEDLLGPPDYTILPKKDN